MEEDKNKIKELEEHNKKLKEIIYEKDKAKAQQESKTNIYYGIRFVQVLCIGVFTFGVLWQGTETFNMNTPQFMMVYGGAGAVISEVVARVFKKKIIK
jgi:hypothetical protein